MASGEDSGARHFLALFTQAPQVFAFGDPYMRVLASTLVATGLESVTAEAVMGSGHTLAVSWIYIVVSLAQSRSRSWRRRGPAESAGAAV